jgi:nicotinic acid mononucleotide adenylyltransferase
MDTAVFSFGRFNPPTKGHEKLVQAMVSVAKQHRAAHFLFLSQTQKAPTDPLSWTDKVRFVKAIFKGVSVSVDTTIKTPFQALELLGKSYKNVILVVGQDRVEDFQTRMELYTEQFGIENFQVVSAGDRDADSDSVEGVSASKARQYAADEQFDKFAETIPDSASLAIKTQIYNKVRQGMGL